MESPQGSLVMSGQGTNGTASVRSNSGGSTGQGEVSLCSAEDGTHRADAPVLMHEKAGAAS